MMDSEYIRKIEELEMENETYKNALSYAIGEVNRYKNMSKNLIEEVKDIKNQIINIRKASIVYMDSIKKREKEIEKCEKEIEKREKEIEKREKEIGHNEVTFVIDTLI